MANKSQKEIRSLGSVTPPMQRLPVEFIARCKDDRDAINLCIQWSVHKKRAYIAEACGISRSYLSQIQSGAKNIPPEFTKKLQVVCGNKAYAQFKAWEMGDELVEDARQKRKQELREELAMIEGEEAA